MDAQSRLSPSDRELISGIAARVRKEQGEARIRTGLRLGQARSEARRVAEGIAGLDGVRRVVHFGSSATGRFFRLDSDIDIAISGGDLFAAMALAETSSFHIDVIDLDRVPAALREAILSEGVILHENA